MIVKQIRLLRGLLGGGQRTSWPHAGLPYARDCRGPGRNQFHHKEDSKNIIKYIYNYIYIIIYIYVFTITIISNLFTVYDYCIWFGNQIYGSKLKTHFWMHETDYWSDMFCLCKPCVTTRKLSLVYICSLPSHGAKLVVVLVQALSSQGMLKTCHQHPTEHLSSKHSKQTI